MIYPTPEISYSITRWMFDCCRIPGKDGKDFSISHAKEGDNGDTGHIVVFRNNRPWLIEAARDGQILGTEEFERYRQSNCYKALKVRRLTEHHRQIQFIYDNSNGNYPGIGVLTASNRDVWAKVCVFDCMVLTDTQLR
jgi:carnitine O-acetyltransferase